MFKALALATLFVSHSVCAEEIINSGDVVLEGHTIVDVEDGVTNIYSGVISGTGPIDKTGPGKLVLSGRNTFTSSTVDNRSMGVRIKQGVIEVAGSKESRIAAKVNGDVSFLNYGAGTLTFEGAGYAQTGDIVATNGTVVIADGARWKSLGNLTASGGARIKIVRTADSLKEQAFGRKTLVHLAEDSVLEIPDGSVQCVKYLYIDGVRMDSGDYSFASIADENVKKHFAETAGVLRCIGEPGMSIVIR